MDTAPINNVISYFRECYRSDNREDEVRDIFHSSVEFRRIIEKKDVYFNGLLPKIALAGEELREVHKTATLQKREKKMYLGFVMCTGRALINDELQRICSPLWIGLAQLTEGVVHHTVAVDLEQVKLNYPLLELLGNLEHPDNPEETRHTLDELATKIPRLPMNDDKLFQLVKVMGEAFPFLELDPLTQYPDQLNQKEIRKKFRKRPSQSLYLSMLPATALLMLKQSISSRGVLAELDEIKASQRYSKPLMSLLMPGNSSAAGEMEQKKSILDSAAVPAVLSRSQEKIVRNASRYVDSLVIGPPGTGKSYTIAAVALDYLSRGQSVLIASKTNQAVDVIADKIEMILGIRNFVIRGGRKQYQKELKTFIDNLLMGIYPVMSEQAGGNPAVTVGEARKWSHQCRQLKERIGKLESKLTRLSNVHQQWGDYRVQPRYGFLARCKAAVKVPLLNLHLKRSPAYWELMNEYRETGIRYLDLSRKLIQFIIKERLGETVHKHRRMMQDFLKAVVAYRAVRKEKFFDRIDFKTIFKAFPIWMVNQSDISQVLPLEVELFDVVLIDEATQCDIAGCLPVLQRARRSVIIGDPKQLRHISFLSRDRQGQIARDAGIEEEDIDFSYRDDSILDLARRRIHVQEKVTFLDEHFRSMPPIIRFSNREFYGGALKIMQEHPKSHEKESLFLNRVNGKREENGVNKAEGLEIIRRLREIIDEQTGRPPGRKNSIGILSPFSDQVEFISKSLSRTISIDEVENHNILVGTPYSFQGEERDIMLIGFCLDNESHPSSFFYLNRSDVFNVAVTRARNLQIINTSFDVTNTKVKGLLARYLSHIVESKNAPESGSSDPSGDMFLKEVGEAFSRNGWQWWPNFPVAGFRVDMVAEIAGKMVGVDLIGYPGDYCGTFELEQYRLFNRAGFPIFPLAYSDWVMDWQRCLDSLEKWVEKKVDP
ncbi:MAG: AAA family ATPase [bacterium]|nr:AAA family ATPase [bacterium]